LNFGISLEKHPWEACLVVQMESRKRNEGIREGKERDRSML
jgi:hypothetical protein